jgi:hypothetical protein
MALAWRHSRGQADQADYDEDDWVGVAEVEVAAAHLLQQKKYPDGDHNDGPHKATDAATLAGATNTIAHL